MKSHLKALLTAVVFYSAAIIPGGSQTKSAMNMDQYLFPEFTACIIKSKTGTETTEAGNYNTITGKMAFLKGNTLYGLALASQADTITFGNRSFVPFGEVFHEVVTSGPITLFIQHESHLIPPGQPVGYGGTSRTSKVDTYSNISTQGAIYGLEVPPDFEIRYMPVYWIRLNGEMHRFLGRTQFMKIFPEHKKQISTFIKSNSIRMENREDLVRLIGYCNELYNK